MATARSAAPERLEDVYQGEIIEAFSNITEFKKFARSRNGLSLNESDIQHTLEDNGSSVDQKMAMLHKWQLITGKDATASRIRYLVDRYHEENSTEQLQSDAQMLQQTPVFSARRMNHFITSTPKNVQNTIELLGEPKDSAERVKLSRSSSMDWPKKIKKKLASLRRSRTQSNVTEEFWRDFDLSEDETAVENILEFWTDSDLSEDETSVENVFKELGISTKPLPNTASKQKTQPSSSTLEEVLVELESAKIAPTALSISSTPLANSLILFNQNDQHIYTYNMVTNDIMKTQKFCDILFFGTAVLGQHIYSFEEKKVRKLKISSPVAEWTRIPGMMENHGWYPLTAACHGSIYVCGSSVKASRSVECFKERRNAWITLPPLSIARETPSVVASKDHVYCIGGENKAGRSAEKFDGRKWTYIEKPPRNIVNANAAVIGKRIYVADDKGVLFYDIQADFWHKFNVSLPEWYFTSDGGMKLFNVNEELYGIGYQSGEVYEIYRLDISTEQMTLIDTIADKKLHIHASLAACL